MQSSTRRQFMGSAVALSVSAPAIVRGQNLNSKLQHASIGVGGMGWGDVNSIGGQDDVAMVAVCDVDGNHLAKAKNKFKGARGYVDWRELLDKEGDKIDSVNITVPDHMHAIIAMNAMQRGKHVYCQKPMCHDVAEVRALTELAAKTGVVTQLGTQFASGRGDRQTVELLKSGIVGKVKRVVMSANRKGAVERYRLVGPRPKSTPSPSSLAWDLWLGTAPKRPFASKVYHPQLWRSWQDFGTGWGGDIGCHIMNAPWKGLGLTAPTHVQARVQESWKNSPERRKETWPQSQHVTWTFPGNELTADDSLIVEWYDGYFEVPEEYRALTTYPNYPGEALLVIGTEGTLLMPHKSGAYMYPEAKYAAFKRPKMKSQDHHEDFVRCCLSGKKTESPFAIGGPMTEAVLLGTIAARVPDRMLRWDAASMTFANSASATSLVRRDYRSGWELPSV